MSAAFDRDDYSEPQSENDQLRAAVLKLMAETHRDHIDIHGWQAAMAAGRHLKIIPMPGDTVRLRAE